MKQVIRKHSAIVITFTDSWGGKVHYVKIGKKFYYAGKSFDTLSFSPEAASRKDGFWYDSIAEILRRNRVSRGSTFSMIRLLNKGSKCTSMMRHWVTHG